MSAPTVSIAIPNYNHGAYLGRAVASALAQTHPVLEVVVVENASTDGSRDVLRAFDDPRLRVVEQLQTVPGYANWNRGLEEIRGDWYVLLHADDMLHPQFVELMLARALATPDAALVACDYGVVDERDRLISREGPWRYHGEAFRGATMRGVRASEASLRRGDNSLATTSMHLCRRAQSIALRGFQKIAWTGDWEFTMRTLACGSYAHVGEMLLYYRRHAESDSIVSAATDDPLLGHLDLANRLSRPDHPYGALAPDAVQAYRVSVAHRLLGTLHAAQQAGDAERTRRLLPLAGEPAFHGILGVTSMPAPAGTEAEPAAV